MRIPAIARERWWSEMAYHGERGVWISGDEGHTWRRAHARQDDPRDFTPLLRRGVGWIIDYSPAGLAR